MRKFIAIFIAVSFLSGCALIPPMPPPHKYYENFDKINSREYILIGDKTYIGGYFVTDPKFADSYTYRQNLTPLYNKRVKVIDNNIKQDRYSIFLSQYRVIENNDGSVSYFTRGFTKLVTEDDNIYYLKKSGSAETLVQWFKNLDGSSLSKQDKFKILGGSIPFEDSSLKVRTDQFEGEKWLITPTVDDVFLRALLDLDTRKIKFIQVYADTSHTGNWAFLQRAKDKKRTPLELVKISTNVDCSKFGCILTETVGINVSKEYLETNKGGIIIQARGQGGKSKIRVPSEMIDLMLKSLREHVIIK